MKLKNLFLPLIAITMCAGFASCDDDDDNDDQEYINSLENILIDGASVPGYDFPGWLISGYAMKSDLGEVSESMEESLPDTKYVSKVTPGIFEKMNDFISFNRNHSFTLYTPDAEGVNIVSGNWSIVSRNSLAFDTQINGKTERVNAEIVKLASNYLLLYMTWPGETSAAYYELYWGEYLNKDEKK